MKYRGRPAKYETVEDMQKLIVEYFNECEAEGKKPTVTGLGYVLDMSRQDLINYEKCFECDRLKQYPDSVRRGFVYTIKSAKRFIESCLEDKLINGNTTPIGLIFALKNNYGWVDKQEIEQTNKTISVELDDE